MQFLKLGLKKHFMVRASIINSSNLDYLQIRQFAMDFAEILTQSCLGNHFLSDTTMSKIGQQMFENG
jgi:hypothetical protein